MLQHRVAILLLSLLVGAGCGLAQAKPDAPEFDVKEHYTKFEYRIAMRDGVAWQVDNVQNTDIMNVKNPSAMNASGVQGVYLAKQPGYTAITLTDPASGKHVKFRFYIVDKAAGSQ